MIITILTLAAAALVSLIGFAIVNGASEGASEYAQAVRTSVTNDPEFQRMLDEYHASK